MHDTDTELLQTLLLTFERAMLVSRCAEGLRAGTRPRRAFDNVIRLERARWKK